MSAQRKMTAPSARRVSWEYKLVFLASYPLFLCGAILSRMSLAGRQSGAPRSVFAQARQSAHMALPYAF